MTRRSSSLLFFAIFVVVYCVSASSWQLPGADVLRWIVIAGLSVGGMLKDGKFHLFSREYYYLALAFGIGIICSIGKDNFFTGIQRTGSFFMLILGMYSYFQATDQIEERVLQGIDIFCVLLELLATVLFFYFFVSGQTIGYYYAIYGNPNYLAPIAVTAFGASLLMYVKSYGLNRIIHLFCGSISVFLVIATGSRAGLLSLMIFFALFPILKDRRVTSLSFLKDIVYAIIILALLYLVAKRLNIPALNRLLAASNSVSSTGVTRGDTWDHGMELFRLKPILGWGSSAAYYNTFINNTTGYNGWGMHSSYITILVDHGLIGTGLMLVFLISILKRMKNMYLYISERSYPEERKTIFVLVMIALALLVDAAAESFLFAVGNFSAICFWVTFCFIDLYLEGLTIRVNCEDS